MGFISTLTQFCLGRSGGTSQLATARQGRSRSPRAPRQCVIEALEPRQLLAADGLVPDILLGSVYFEEATGDDSRPDVIQVSFAGGAPGTTLERLVINGDKRDDGLSEGDIIFDTSDGGLGAFASVGLSLVSTDGFDVTSVAVVDGGSQITFTLSGFEAGEKLVFSVDADEVQFMEAGAVDDGVVDPSKVDINSLVEGAEFQRSTITGEFKADRFVDSTLVGIFWDDFDGRFADALDATGQTLDLPNDRYSADVIDDFIDRTAGAIVHEAQIPLATLSGWVYHDRSDDGLRDPSTEEGIGGVELELVDENGQGTGITTFTSTDPGKVGYYEFDNLFPGTYGVREVHPEGWLDGQDRAGSHGGSAADETAGRVDLITGAVLDFGDDAINYNFGELLAGSISGRVHAHNGPDCDFEIPEILLDNVQIDLLDAEGNVLLTTFTDAQGEYSFVGLRPGEYQVRQHQPAEYYDGEERAGTAGGLASDIGVTYSIVSQIALVSDQDAINYDFCEHVGANLAGWVYHDRSNDGNFDRPAEEGIGGVTVQLLSSGGVPTGITAITSSDPGKVGFYEFLNLDAGSYGVREFQPTGWLDGIDTPGSHGGLAADESTGRVDMITSVALEYGDDAVEYNFGELLGSTISGRVHADTDGDCDFDDPDILLEDVEIQLLDAEGNLLEITFTDENGEYEFTGLRPGEYQVREIQPTAYFDGVERVGSAGGELEPTDTIKRIVLTSGTNGVNYDFCEHVGVTLSGNVYHDRSNDGVFDRDTEEGIGGVTLKLLDGDGVDTGRRAETESDGSYQFADLAAGKYSIMEIHPSGWLDGIDTPGNLGGVADASPPGDMIGMIMIEFGQRGVEYNFGELQPTSISGRVIANNGPECDFDHPYELLEGVEVQLLNADGNQVLETTFTDANGEYEFTGLRPGEYQVREIQPTGYADGDDHVGSAGGELFDTDIIRKINLTSGTDGTRYDFCEHILVTLSGNVYHDRSNDGVFDRDTEEGIGGVTLKLLDAAGNDTGLRAETNHLGYYEFTQLAAGMYSVMEDHPNGWLDGIDTPGNLGGVADPSPPGDMISQIEIKFGQVAVEYNFGELLPGKIHGRVHVSTDPNCEANGEEVPIEGVVIELLDVNGQVIETTETDAEGEYWFMNLRPGTYSVRELQPADYFDGNAHIGSGGGTALTRNLIGDIEVGSNEMLVHYDFCEEPPAELSGFVFIDGPPIVMVEALTPDEVVELRDGVRTPDDAPLAGVTLELRDGNTGVAIMNDQALPGAYPDGPIRTVTDSNGFYHFGGLRAGNYAVTQVQPDDLIDGIDTPGSLGGFAVNPGPPAIGRRIDPTSESGEVPDLAIQQLINQFRESFGNDAILRISIGAGQHSQENNFSEVRTLPFQVPPESDPPPPPPFVAAPPAVPFVPPPVLPPLLPPVDPPDIFGGSSNVVGYTWHLSVIDAGRPRAMRSDVARFHLAGTQIDLAAWRAAPMRHAEWILATQNDGGIVIEREAIFGHPQATPVVGDFNGDGVSELGVFVVGQWYLDLNGNGRWDEGDLWAQLGSRDDLPATGDWDGDGKDDIGIFGPVWPRDPWAIAREPGLPVVDNFPTRPEGKAKNMPPDEEDATSGARTLKLTASGKPRADLIDHVFHYGTAGDVPVTGDWNGDGIKAIGVFRDGTWYLDLNGDGRFTERDAVVQFGEAGDLPVVGDWNGDGIDELGVFHNGWWLIDSNANRQVDALDRAFELGEAGDVPVTGDWNGDGADDPGVYRATAPSDRVTRN